MIGVRGMGGRRRRKDEGETPAGPVDWRRLIGYLRPFWGWMVLGILGSMVSAALSLVFPRVIQNVIDTVLTERNTLLLDQITVFLLVVFLLRTLSSMFESYIFSYVGESIVRNVRLELYDRVQRLSLDFFIKRRVGELVSRFSNDATQMRSALTSTVGQILQQVLIGVGSIIVMVTINWQLTAFIMLITPIGVGSGFFFGRRLRRLSTAISDAIAESTTVVEEVLQNIREVKSFVREPYEQKRYGGAIRTAFETALKLVRTRVLFSGVIPFLGFASTALVLWFGGREVIAGRLSGGELISFLIYGISLTGSVGGLISLYSNFQEALGATKRIFQIMDEVPRVLDQPNAEVMGRVEGRIMFEDVSFSYDERQEILHRIALDIAPGEIIALVGPSGAGKSTMFNLIPRFYDPSAGRVLIDGTDARTVTQASLREQIGIVPQETLLFGGTIEENIRYGRLEASEDEIFAAARAANAHDFILELPDGYQTIVGERGVRLSGGQRQRVAIARAILKDPRILLLDEATSSLDSESEFEVQEALARLMQNRTTVIIAHRLSTVRIAHRIVVMQKGAITELGTHDELMALNGLYARLYSMQFRQDLIDALEGAPSPMIEAQGD